MDYGLEQLQNSVLAVVNKLEALRQAQAKGHKIVFWGAGKRLPRIIEELCEREKALPMPNYIVDSTRKIADGEFTNCNTREFSELLNEDPTNTTIIITAGILDLQSQIIKNELYYFDIMHIRSIETALYLKERLGQIDYSYSLLKNSESKETYLSVLINVVNGAFFDSSKNVPGAYFGNGVASLPDNGTLIFAGAFNGKHIRRFRKASHNLEIMAFEPSPYWSEKLKLEFASDSLVKVSNCLLGAQSMEVHYDPDYENHGLAARIEKESSKSTIKLPLISLDEFFFAEKISSPVVQISLDIEGAEQQALVGAQKIIDKFLPTLTVCIYHSADDYVNIPRLIDEMQPGRYDFFVLQHSPVQPIETVLYAIPKNRR